MKVCVIGSGTRFLSGISYYTLRLANALAGSHQVSVITMRQLLPTRFYPGQDRVGMNLTPLRYDKRVRLYDGVDWFWFPSIFSAIALLLRERPDVIVFQWWTGTVLHSYLVLAAAAWLLGTRVVLEFHEVLDPAEANMPLAQAYIGLTMPLLLRFVSAFVIHSEYDRCVLQKVYKLGDRPIALIPHGPYDHYRLPSERAIARVAPASCCNLLFFGTIRPYKGLEDLIIAFETIPEDQIKHYWLTVVGETWQGGTLPAELIARSRYRDRITFINRYVEDGEVARFFTEADAVVLPYHRSSASGPLHIAMSYGLPIVVTGVGGLTEAVAAYEGAILVPPKNPGVLATALVEVSRLRGRRFSDPHSWEDRVARYNTLFAAICGNRAVEASAVSVFSSTTKE